MVLPPLHTPPPSDTLLGRGAVPSEETGTFSEVPVRGAAALPSEETGALPGVPVRGTASLPFEETLSSAPANPRAAEHVGLLPRLQGTDLECAACGNKTRKGVTRFHVALALGLAAVLLIVTTGLAVYFAVSDCNQRTEHQIQTECVPSSPAGNGKDGAVLPPCGDDWIWYRYKCYYFSEEAGNWTEAKDLCAALNSSLAKIDSKKELDFLLHHKGDLDRWIGLSRRDPDQPWIWVDGTEFNNTFTVEDHSECAYLGRGKIKSSECYSTRRWSCTKMSYYEKLPKNH